MGYIRDLREHVGHMPIMAISTTCIMYDSENRTILFQQRSDTHTWGVPGGVLEIGESIYEGLAREVKEETGLDILDAKLYDIRVNKPFKYPNGDVTYYTEFICVSTEFSGELSHDDEGDDLQWFSINDLPRDISPFQEEYIRRFVEVINEEDFSRKLRSLPN